MTLAQPLATAISSEPPRPISLEEYLQHPPQSMEWVDGSLEKKAVTLRHANIQARLSSAWGTFLKAHSLGGKIYTEAVCRTLKQGRRPDIAYLPADLAEQYADAVSLPHSFPLIAEIASPEDAAEALLLKAQEYLQSGGREVWLVFPESQRILVITASREVWFTALETAKTQIELPGFAISVAELVGE